MRAGRPTAFVVLTSPRTGSSWLIDLLDSHPRIAAYAELFLPGDAGALPDYGCRDLPRFEATLGPRRRLSLVPARIGYLRRLFAARADLEAIGFKLMHRQVNAHPGLVPYLATRRARAIHLRRENGLEQFVSWKTAVARDSFRALSGDEVPDVRVRLDVEELSARLARRQDGTSGVRNAIERYRLQSLDVCFEQLVATPNAELARVVDFLGVEPREWAASSNLVRMNASPWRTCVENVAEVEGALAGTPHAWMLGDGP